MSRHTRQIFEFSQFRLDIERSRLTRDGELVSLPPKAVSLLTTLLKHQGRAVEKEELMETIWPDMVVEDSNLTQTVHILRKTLSKFPDSNISIETLPRFGYRLVAEVRECGSEGEAQATQLLSVLPDKAKEIEERLSIGQPSKGWFHSVEKALFYFFQKRVMKVGTE